MEEINRNFLVELMDLLTRYNASIDSKEFGPMMEGVEIEIYGEKIVFISKIDKDSIMNKLQQIQKDA